MSPQLKAAIVRGIIISIPTGLLTTLTTWSQTDDVKTLVIAGCSSFLGTFLLRSGLEGGYDTKRQQDGDVQAGDVRETAAPDAPPTAQPV